MKKVVLLLILVCFVSFAFAIPWGHCYTTWQTQENPSLTTGESETFAVEWGEGGWTSTNFGYGTSTDGSAWTWVEQAWVEDGDATNKRCSTVVQFNTQGTYYYAYRMIKDAVSYYSFGDPQWIESVTSISAIHYVTVSEAPLPICLASFIANANKGNVVLEWTTASETENSHFLVYRDGEVIGLVDGAGTTTEPHNYSYTDTRVLSGTHSYAISDVTWGGIEIVHAPINVEIEEEILLSNFVMHKAYPNPFNPRVVVSMEYGVGSEAVVNIYNTQGVLVDQLINGFMEAGSHELTWDASGMPSGVYVVTMQVGNTVQSQKIVLMK